VPVRARARHAIQSHTRSRGFDLHLTTPVDIGALEAWLSGA
jgi:hypothetical protein